MLKIQVDTYLCSHVVKSFFYISGKNWYICGNFFLHNVDHFFTFVVDFYICGQYFHICGRFYIYGNFYI